MLQANAVQFIGTHPEGGYIGYISEDSLFLVISYEDGVTQEEGDRLISTIQINFPDEIKSLSDFDAKLSDLIIKSNLPAHFSLAAGYVRDNVIYVKTVGKGQIYVRRGKDFTLLIEGTKSASGYLKQFDCFTFTTSHLYDLYGSTKELEMVMGRQTPGEVLQELEKENFTADEKKGLITLFIEFVIGEDRPVIQNFEAMGQLPKSSEPLTAAANPYRPPVAAVAQAVPVQQPQEPFSPAFPKRSMFSGFSSISSNRQKMFTFGGVAVIFGILLWSVVFGYQRRANDQIDKKIAASKQVIDKKLSEAEESAFLNLDKSISLIGEAKAEYEKVKKEVGDKRPNELKELESTIQAKEGSIVKKEEKSFDEFYDLALEDKDATGKRIYLDGENAAILDSENGAVYVLSLPKKSIEKNSSGEVKGANLVALYEDNIYVVKAGTGVFNFTSETKTAKVIEAKDWGDIVDVHMYGGNLYLLDQGKDEIYKYIPVADGFSDKSSYFASGQSVDLGSASSLAIDSSVYIAIGDVVAKYTSGSREDIKTDFPDEDVTLDKVYTNADIEKVYAWNKAAGSIYILGKNGAYEKQVKSSILTKADDFTVFEDAAYILSGQKIYKMNLK